MAVLIRFTAAEDAAAIAAIYRSYVEDSRISFEESAPDAAEVARRIAGDGRGLHPWLVAEEDGRLLGFANGTPFRARVAYRWAVETGIYLSRSTWPRHRHGLADRAGRAARTPGFRHRDRRHRAAQSSERGAA